MAPGAICKKDPTASFQNVQVLPEIKAGAGFEPEAYREYVEDSNPATSAEIG